MVSTLQDWISKFFAVNTQITASLVGRNVLIDQVLTSTVLNLYCIGGTLEQNVCAGPRAGGGVLGEGTARESGGAL